MILPPPWQSPAPAAIWGVVNNKQSGGSTHDGGASGAGNNTPKSGYPQPVGHSPQNGYQPMGDHLPPGNSPLPEGTPQPGGYPLPEIPHQPGSYPSPDGYPTPGGYPPPAPRPTPPQRPPEVVVRHPPVRRPVGSQGQRPRKPARRYLQFSPACVLPVLALLAILGVLAIYFLAPAKTTILIMGIDYVEPGSAVARTDTIMVASVNPLKPTIKLLSIPRDLWVNIPGVGENRINTAHFYAESQQAGSGPGALQNTIEQNFGIRAPYYARIRFEGFRDVVDALGGVDIVLDQPMNGYPVGKHHLTGRKALAFVRNRSDADDFFRMSHGQFMVRALFKDMLRPSKWVRIPAVVRALLNSVDTNIPKWMWPRLGFALLRAGPNGIKSYLINREMVTPITTPQGASVLAPNWDLIHPLIREIFASQ